MSQVRYLGAWKTNTVESIQGENTLPLVIASLQCAVYSPPIPTLQAAHLFPSLFSYSGTETFLYLAFSLQELCHECSPDRAGFLLPHQTELDFFYPHSSLPPNSVQGPTSLFLVFHIPTPLHCQIRSKTVNWCSTTGICVQEHHTDSWCQDLPCYSYLGSVFHSALLVFCSGAVMFSKIRIIE